MQKKYAFPYDPYPIQTDFMNNLYDSLFNCKGGLLESPTGTGKTLSVICASITFLYDKYKFHLQDSNVTPDPVKKICLPPTTELPHISYLKNNIKLEEKVKIVYLSRTHSQLDQFTNEFKKTQWGQNNLLSFIRLASRSQLCVNSSVNKDKITINYNCNTIIKKKQGINVDEEEEKNGDGVDEHKFCSFYENRYEVKNEILGKICDIEDLVKIGKRTHGCPYFGTRLGINEADFIVAPYNSVINRNIRKSLELDLSKCHLIFDEAHNIVQTIIDSYSAEISKSQILSCFECLYNYKGLYQDKMLEKKLLFIDLSIKILKKLKNFLSENEKNYNITIQRQIFLESLKIENVNFIELNTYFEESNIAQKVLNLGSESPKQPRNNFKGLIAFQDFLRAIHEINGEIIFFKSIDDEFTIKFLITDPYEKFKNILDESLSINLTGGTLSPPQEFLKLFESIPSSKLKKFSCGHVIPPDQLILTCLERSAKNLDLKFVFDNRDKPILYKELGKILYELCCFVPNGIVVFVPSYSFLASLKAMLSKSRIDKISEKKIVFFDNRNKKILKDFSEAAEGKGAILFAVMRGSLSEGIDFSDKLGRCVVVVGLPYLNKIDPEVQLKMKYYDKMKGYSGYKFYENACEVAINQAIGRAIRHIGDYAAILLIDSRHSSKLSRRPKWMHPSIKCNLNYSGVISALQTFFSHQTSTKI